MLLWRDRENRINVAWAFFSSAVLILLVALAGIATVSLFKPSGSPGKSSLSLSSGSCGSPNWLWVVARFKLHSIAFLTSLAFLVLAGVLGDGVGGSFLTGCLGTTLSAGAIAFVSGICVSIFAGGVHFDFLQAFTTPVAVGSLSGLLSAFARARGWTGRAVAGDIANAFAFVASGASSLTTGCAGAANLLVFVFFLGLLLVLLLPILHLDLPMCAGLVFAGGFSQCVSSVLATVGPGRGGVPRRVILFGGVETGSADAGVFSEVAGVPPR